MMNGIKTWLRRFMAGRYGHDDMSLRMLMIAAVCLLFAAVSRNRQAALFFVFILILLVGWSLWRMLSRNKAARERENALFRKITGGAAARSKPFTESMKAWWENIKGIKLFQDKKTYGLKMCLFKCPGCGVDVRIPANKGKVLVTCPRCGRQFERIS